MPEKAYIIPYSEDVRKRHYHQTIRGKVVKFMVQLEVKVEGKWREVVRYDCAHGYAHRDSYSLQWKSSKEELNIKLEEALTLADNDIDDNWEVYKNKFLGGGLP